MSNMDEKRYKVTEKAIRSQPALAKLIRPDSEAVILANGQAASIPSDVVEFTAWMLSEGCDALKAGSSQIHTHAARFFGLGGAPRMKFTRPAPAAAAAEAPAPKPKRVRKPKKVVEPDPAPAPAKAEAAPAQVPAKVKRTRVRKPKAVVEAKPALPAPPQPKETELNGSLASTTVQSEGITMRLKPPSGMKTIQFSAKQPILACLVSVMMILEQFVNKHPKVKEWLKDIDRICSEISKAE